VGLPPNNALEPSTPVKMRRRGSTQSLGRQAD
jgi:hypothetical protein